MHLTAEMFNQMAGINLALVPYRGMAPVVTDLIGSHVSLGIIDPPSGMSAIEAGKIKPLAVTSIKRSPRLPEVPTVAESGVPGFESNGSFGIVAPAGTPADVIAKLNAAFVDGPQRSGDRQAHPRAWRRTAPDDAGRVRYVR